MNLPLGTLKVLQILEKTLSVLCISVQFSACSINAKSGYVRWPRGSHCWQWEMAHNSWQWGTPRKDSSPRTSSSVHCICARLSRPKRHTHTHTQICRDEPQPQKHQEKQCTVIRNYIILQKMSKKKKAKPSGIFTNSRDSIALVPRHVA